MFLIERFKVLCVCVCVCVDEIKCWWENRMYMPTSCYSVLKRKSLAIRC